MSSVKSSLEPLEGNKVKLSVNVDEAEFDRDIDQAFRKIAREVRLPGFRAGKAPRRVLEARIGLAPAREQALRDAIPHVPGARPCASTTSTSSPRPRSRSPAARTTAPSGFDATCEVRPEITVRGYGGLRVELPAPEATDEEVDEAVRRRAAPPRRAHRRRPPGGQRRHASRSTSPPPATARRSPG